MGGLSDRTYYFLDIGTGTGAISLSLLSSKPKVSRDTNM